MHRPVCDITDAAALPKGLAKRKLSALVERAGLARKSVDILQNELTFGMKSFQS